MKIKNLINNEDAFYRICSSFVVILAAFVWSPYFFAERMWSDEALYAWGAKRIFADPLLMFSPEISYPHPPLFPALLSLSHFVLSPLLGCRLVMFMFYLIGMLAIYALGKRMGGPFVALVSMAALAWHYYYFSYSVVILIDLPMAVFCTVLAILLLKINEHSSLRYHAGIGLWGSAIVLLKWPGAVILPFLLLFYLLGIQRVSLKRKLQLFLVPFFIIGTVIALFVLKNYVQQGNVFPQQKIFLRVSNFQHFDQVFSLIFFVLRETFRPIGLVFFLIVGSCTIIVRKQYKEALILIVWPLLYLIGLQVMTIQMEMRFVLCILPMMIMLTVLGVEVFFVWITGKVFFLRGSSKYSLAIFCLVLCLFDFYYSQPYIMEKGDFQYTGYAEAGQVVKALTTPDAIVLAGSERQIRYFSDINYQEFGGQIVAFRQNHDDFNKMVNGIKSPIVLVIDIWELLQPEWAYTMTSETRTYLTEHGFRLRHIVVRPVSDGQKIWRRPVILILTRDKVS